MLSEFYHLRRTAIKDVCAYVGFLAGFIGAAPFAWGLLGDQLASGAFVRGLWYFFGIVVAAGIFTGIAGLGIGAVAGILWEQLHRYRRREKLKASAMLESVDEPEESMETNLDGPRLRLVRDEAPPDVNIKAILFLFMSLAPLASGAQAVKSVEGIWRGTSKCLVQPSACHDEVVVYYINRTDPDSGQTGQLFVTANRITNGVEVDMGTLGPCTFTQKTSALKCPMPAGLKPGEWRFILRGDSLDGGLWTPGEVKFREVHVRRSPDRTAGKG